MATVLKRELSHPDLLARMTQGVEQAAANIQQALIIEGGIIRPLVNGQVNQVDAIGIFQGKVVTAGTGPQVKKAIRQTGASMVAIRRLNASQTLLPGLIEPHVHIIPSALTGDWRYLGGFDGQVLRSGYNMDWVAQQIKFQIGCGSHPEQSLSRGCADSQVAEFPRAAHTAPWRCLEACSG